MFKENGSSHKIKATLQPYSKNNDFSLPSIFGLSSFHSKEAAFLRIYQYNTKFDSIDLSCYFYCLSFSSSCFYSEEV